LKRRSCKKKPSAVRPSLTKGEKKKKRRGGRAGKEEAWEAAFFPNAGEKNASPYSEKEERELGETRRSKSWLFLPVPKVACLLSQGERGRGGRIAKGNRLPSTRTSNY